jgi:hypothetical protein
MLGICAAAAWLPGYLNRVQVPGDYDDVPGLEGFKGYWLEPPPYRVGDLLAYRVGDGPEAVGFGRIVALEGDTVSVADNALVVSGKPVDGGAGVGNNLRVKDVAPVVVPAGHYYVLSKGHARDSVVRGMIGPDVLLGKVRE